MADAGDMASRQYIPQQVRSVPAKFSLQCPFCLVHVEEGDYISFFEPDQEWGHTRCVEQEYSYCVD